MPAVISSNLKSIYFSAVGIFHVKSYNDLPALTSTPILTNIGVLIMRVSAATDGDGLGDGLGDGDGVRIGGTNALLKLDDMPPLKI